jgi:hypothetical protein
MRIRFSRNYNEFSFHKANRKLVRKKVESLKKSMARMNLLPNAPVICKQRKNTLEIFDGQHRFQAAKEMGISIAFTLLDDNKEIDGQRIDMCHVAEFNAEATGWTIPDAVHHHCVRNNPHYIKLQEFVDEYKFNHSISALMLSAKTSADNVSRKSFFHANATALRTGEFEVKDYATGVRLADIVYDFRPYFKKFQTRNFVHALMYLAIRSKYNHKRMMEKMFKYDGLLKFQATTGEFVENIEYVFNYKSAQQNRVTFM